MMRETRRPKAVPGEIRVNSYSEKWLRKGFPWVYPKEVVASSAAPGEVVLLRSDRDLPLGRAIADSGWLAARVYRRDEGDLDDEWLSGLLDRAALLRDRVVPSDTTAFRLVNGENDGLPGVRVDLWGHFAVVSMDSPACTPLLDPIVEWLKVNREPRGVIACWRPDPRDERDFSAVSPQGLVFGHPPPGDVRVRERGLEVDVRPLEAPDVGLYCDMRDVRTWLEPCWGGASVLNLFAFTGVFSVAAAKAGASDVVSVDLSAPNLERAQQNFRINGLDPSHHEFQSEDAFKALDRFRRTGQSFDRVIADPPAFSHSPAGTWSARKDWPRLVAACARVVAPDGWLILASNQGEISPREFRGLVGEGLERAGREGQLLANLGQAPDFPAATTFPEGRYLKVEVLRL
jgi:23S rRNA (cytosine1962-C5)-methyltransferase